MKKEELIKAVIEQTIEQVILTKYDLLDDFGCDLLDEFDSNRDNAIQKIYDAIKEKI